MKQETKPSRRLKMRIVPLAAEGLSLAAPSTFSSEKHEEKRKKDF